MHVHLSASYRLRLPRRVQARRKGYGPVFLQVECPHQEHGHLGSGHRAERAVARGGAPRGSAGWLEPADRRRVSNQDLGRGRTATRDRISTGRDSMSRPTSRLGRVRDDPAARSAGRGSAEGQRGKFQIGRRIHHHVAARPAGGRYGPAVGSAALYGNEDPLLPAVCAPAVSEEYHRIPGPSDQFARRLDSQGVLGDNQHAGCCGYARRAHRKALETGCADSVRDRPSLQGTLESDKPVAPRADANHGDSSLLREVEVSRLGANSSIVLNP